MREKATVFRGGRWLTVALTALMPGDHIWHEGSLMEVMGFPVNEYQGPTVALMPVHETREANEADYVPKRAEKLAMAMDLAGADLVTFEDGAGQLCRLDGEAKTYSPRLPLDELNTFCGEHIDRYRDFFKAHQDEIEKDISVTMQPWWTH